MTAPTDVAGPVGSDRTTGPVTTSLALESGDLAVPGPSVGPEQGPAPHPLVVGLDLSLVATGIAHMTHAGVVTDLVTADGSGLIRLRRLAYTIRNLCGHADLVCIEGPAYHQGMGAGYHERAGLHWLVLDRLWKTSTPVAIVGPSVLKQYATGKGNANKDAMVLAAARRFPTFDGDNNQADALWLAALGLDHLTGQSVVPVSHRAKLASVHWPTVTRAAS